MGWFREDLLDVWHKSGSWPGRVNLSLGLFERVAQRE